MAVRGIRGATTVRHNDADEILQATTTMLQHIVAQNDVEPKDIANIWMTMTGDLNAAFPARAVWVMPGWELVPLMCATEIPVQNGLPLCIRLMMAVNTEKTQSDICHVYLNEATRLRPDLA